MSDHPRMLTPAEIEDLRAETKRNVEHYKRLLEARRGEGDLDVLKTPSDRPPLPVK